MNVEPRRRRREVKKKNKDVDASKGEGAGNVEKLGVKTPLSIHQLRRGLWGWGGRRKGSKKKAKEKRKDTG